MGCLGSLWRPPGPTDQLWYPVGIKQLSRGTDRGRRLDKLLRHPQTAAFLDNNSPQWVSRLERCEHYPATTLPSANIYAL